MMKTIVVVEDSDEDFDVLKFALESASFPGSIERFETGDCALDALSSGEIQKDTFLILLDLNLPGTNGKEVLAQFRKKADTKHIPIIIVSTSSAPEDILECYSQGANSYIQKPVDFKSFVEHIDHILNYWDKLVISPHAILKNYPPVN